jgi:hypothetical protein
VTEQADPIDTQFGPLGVFDENLEGDKLVKYLPGDKVITVDKMQVNKESASAFIRALKRQFSDRNTLHMFKIRIIKGEAWLKLALNKKWFLGLFRYESAGDTAMAKVSDILTAYLKLGIKSNANSVHQTLVTLQRTNEDTLNASAFGQIDAFIIARYIRSKEQLRLESFQVTPDPKK